MRKHILALFIGLFLGCLAVIALYYLPPVHERLAWRVSNLVVQVRRFLQPPEELLFVPQGPSGTGVVETLVKATLSVLLPSSTPIPTASNPPETNSAPTAALLQPSPAPLASPTPTTTPTPQPTPLPEQVLLSGVIHEYQQFNNCGPTNLAMALSFWGWQGNQNDTRAFLRPNRDIDDKNVNPSEMVTFVQDYTGLRALTRLGGDLDLLRRFIAAGFPMLIEKGHDPRDDWWMGHYMVINGYDDSRQRFTAQDSLSNPDALVPYAELLTDWRSFNYVYIVIYPPEREAEVLSLLGPDQDIQANFARAAGFANAEIEQLTGRELFFAWFNLGSSLVGMENYPMAANAFDQAFAIYAHLPEEPEDPQSRPFRMMWYQAGPYPAYYYTARYEDVVSLANTTLSWVSQPVLEETYFWRGMAQEALGKPERAISDYKKAAALNPNYAPPREALQRLGVPLP
jgi:hypothetical protein